MQKTLSTLALLLSIGCGKDQIGRKPDSAENSTIEASGGRASGSGATGSATLETGGTSGDSKAKGTGGAGASGGVVSTASGASSAETGGSAGAETGGTGSSGGAGGSGGTGGSGETGGSAGAETGGTAGAGGTGGSASACVDDADLDGVCDDRDVCAGNDASGDADGDLVCDDTDACAGNDASGDTDGDLVCDEGDICPGEDDATADPDDDGVCQSIEDLLRTEWNAVAVQGTYSEPGPILAADVDADGDLDWISAHLNERRIVLWENDGGFFESFAAKVEGKPRWHDVFDLDGDDDLDVVYGGIVSSSFSTLSKADDDFELGPEVRLADSVHTHVLAMDIDGDEFEDLVAYDSGDDVFVFVLNDTTGLGTPTAFDDVVDGQFRGPGLAAYDVNADTKQDLVVSTSEGLGWYENTGDGFGTYTPISGTGIGSVIQVVDLDGDSHRDIVGQTNGLLHWYRNQGDGTFSYQILLVSGSWDFFEVADIDRDGRVDFVFSAVDPARVAWSEQNQQGFFSPPTTIGTGTTGGWIEVGDFDGDDDLDVVWADADLPGYIWFANPRY